MSFEGPNLRNLSSSGSRYSYFKHEHVDADCRGNMDTHGYTTWYTMKKACVFPYIPMILLLKPAWLSWALRTNFQYHTPNSSTDPFYEAQTPGPSREFSRGFTSYFWGDAWWCLRSGGGNLRAAGLEHHVTPFDSPVAGEWIRAKGGDLIFEVFAESHQEAI